MSRYKHTQTARKVLRSLVPVICPPEARSLADAIVDHMELMFDATPALVRGALAAGFSAYDTLSLPRYRRRAHALSEDQAEAYYDSWQHGTPVHRQFAVMLNQVMSMSCYEQPEMMASVGYHVDAWVQTATKKRLTVFADDIKRREADILAPDPLRPSVRRTKDVA